MVKKFWARGRPPRRREPRLFWRVAASGSCGGRTRVDQRLCAHAGGCASRRAGGLSRGRSRGSVALCGDRADAGADDACARNRFARARGARVARYDDRPARHRSRRQQLSRSSLAKPTDHRRCMLWLRESHYENHPIGCYCSNGEVPQPTPYHPSAEPFLKSGSSLSLPCRPS